MVRPICCKSTMVFLCAFVGARIYWCPRCDRVVDVLTCCGHEHTDKHGEAAPGVCSGCGYWRTSLHPNAAGEKQMREIALIKAKDRLEKARRNV